MSAIELKLLVVFYSLIHNTVHSPTHSFSHVSSAYFYKEVPLALPNNSPPWDCLQKIIFALSFENTIDGAQVQPSSQGSFYGVLRGK